MMFVAEVRSVKLDEAVTLGKQGEWVEVQVRGNPSGLQQWFVMLRSRDNKAYILADNDDEAIAMADLNALTQLIQRVGASEFTVFI